MFLAKSLEIVSNFMHAPFSERIKYMCGMTRHGMEKENDVEIATEYVLNKCTLYNVHTDAAVSVYHK